MGPHGYPLKPSEARPLDFLYDPVNETKSIRTYYQNFGKAGNQHHQLEYVPIYPHMFSCLPQFHSGYYHYKDNDNYPYNIDTGYPKPRTQLEPDVETSVRGKDRWQSYKRPHLPYYDGPIQYLEYRFPPVRDVINHCESTDRLQESSELHTRSVACQTDYRVQSAQTDPTAALGSKLREAYAEFDTIYPQQCNPFTVKTISLIERGLRLRKLHAEQRLLTTPREQMNLFAKFEYEKWAYIGAEMSEAMEDRLTTFRGIVSGSQNYLAKRIATAQSSLNQIQQRQFDEEMAVVWYDANIWRRFHKWTREFTQRKIEEWQTNPPDVQLLKQVPETFAHDARRYVPKKNQGDVISGLTWDNHSNYFLDTWDGFSKVLDHLDPKHLQTEIFLPPEDQMYGAKGYVKRKFKQAARFEQISFSFSDMDYGDSQMELATAKNRKKHPSLLRPRPSAKTQKPMLRVPPMDTEHIAKFQAGVTIQKLVRGRGMQTMIQAGVKLRKELIDEVRGNVALTDQAKVEMKKKYHDYLNRGRILLFYRYRMRFIDSFLSAVEAQIGTQCFRENHSTLVRHLEFEQVDRLKRYALNQRRMREAKEAGRRQQDQRRFAEKEETVQLFQQSHHVPAARAVKNAVAATETYLEKEAHESERKQTWTKIVEAENKLSTAWTQQEKETFIASMVYSFMIPNVQRKLIHEKQNIAMESRRLAIHRALFSSISTLRRKQNRTKHERPNQPDTRSPIDHPKKPRKIVPVIRSPTHRLDAFSWVYRKYLKCRTGQMRSVDTELNFSPCAEITPPTSDLFIRKYRADNEKPATEINLKQLQRNLDRIINKLPEQWKAHMGGTVSEVRLLQPRFDRIDRSKLRKITLDPRLALTLAQQDQVNDIFQESPDLGDEKMKQLRTRLRRKHARQKAGRLWSQAEIWLQEQISIYHRNRVRAYGLEPIKQGNDAPQANIIGRTMSKVEVEDLAKLPAVTLTVHTTGAPEDGVDDVIVINELTNNEYTQQLLPDEDCITSHIVQSKLNY